MTPDDVERRVARYRKGFLEIQAAGLDVSDSGIAKACADLRRELMALANGLCPQCGKNIERKLDPRQAGPTEFGGIWFNYRCSACGFFTDVAELG